MPPPANDSHETQFLSQEPRRRRADRRRPWGAPAGRIGRAGAAAADSAGFLGPFGEILLVLVETKQDGTGVRPTVQLKCSKYPPLALNAKDIMNARRGMELNTAARRIASSNVLVGMRYAVCIVMALAVPIAGEWMSLFIGVACISFASRFQHTLGVSFRGSARNTDQSGKELL